MHGLIIIKTSFLFKSAFLSESRLNWRVGNMSENILLTVYQNTRMCGMCAAPPSSPPTLQRAYKRVLFCIYSRKKILALDLKYASSNKQRHSSTVYAISESNVVCVVICSGMALVIVCITCLLPLFCTVRQCIDNGNAIHV